MSSVPPENPNTQNAADGQSPCGIYTIEDWMRRWEEGTTDWVVTYVDPMLLKYEGKIFEGRTQKLHVFIPLCGKTPDMKWFADKGHEVVGVESYAPAIELFFSEQGMQYSSAVLPNLSGKLYQSGDGMIKIYCCDLYLLSKDLLGQFDIIWDSSSLIAINLADHKRYRDLLLSLMKPDGLYLLSTSDYDGSVFKALHVTMKALRALHINGYHLAGPPHSFSVEHVQELYGGFTSRQTDDLLRKYNLHVTKRTLQLTVAAQPREILPEMQECLLLHLLDMEDILQTAANRDLELNVINMIQNALLTSEYDEVRHKKLVDLTHVVQVQLPACTWSRS